VLVVQAPMPLIARSRCHVCSSPSLAVEVDLAGCDRTRGGAERDRAGGAESAALELQGSEACDGKRVGGVDEVLEATTVGAGDGDFDLAGPLVVGDQLFADRGEQHLQRTFSLSAGLARPNECVYTGDFPTDLPMIAAGGRAQWVRERSSLTHQRRDGIGRTGRRAGYCFWSIERKSGRLTGRLVERRRSRLACWPVTPARGR
jgi:hypothetical protein